MFVLYGDLELERQNGNSGQMARADLLINLVKASVRRDQQTVKRTVEAMVAEERSKQHTLPAERLGQGFKAQLEPTFRGGSKWKRPSKFQF